MTTVTIRYDDGYSIELHVMPGHHPRYALHFPQHGTIEGRDAAMACQREGKFDIESILAQLRKDDEARRLVVHDRP